MIAYKETQRGKRRHLLLPAELVARFPALGATDGNPQARAIAKFFSPYTGWTWFAFEYDRASCMFFGFVIGAEKEWGYFGLEELETATAFNGLVPAVERDCHTHDLPTKAELGL
jgi:hypothetical protein